MAADGPDSAVRRAGLRATITQTTLDRALTIIMAAGAVGFGALYAPTAMAQLDELRPVFGAILEIAVGAALVGVGVGGVLPRAAMSSRALLAIVFVLALASWPLVMRGALPANEVPWPWYFCNVATTAAALSFTVRPAAAYCVIVPMVYALVRLTPEGGGVALARASLDGVYMLILGGAGLVLIVVLRRAAEEVDTAQSAAVRRYARAISEDATERERVQVDAIVHDSVLASFLAAARASDEPSKALAVTMAANALDHLAEEDGERPQSVSVPVSVMRSRVEASLGALAGGFTVRERIDDRTIPEPVVDALVAATVQACVNSVQHAGGSSVSRRVQQSTVGSVGVQIEVIDDGIGFVPSAVPPERLGVRRSIVERLESIGGSAVVQSSPGRGTRVTLRWPAFDAVDDVRGRGA